MFDYRPLVSTMKGKGEKTEDIAELLDIPLEELRDKLNGGKYLTMGQLHKLCEHYECGPEKIMNWLPSADYIKIDWQKVAGFGKPLTVLSVECGMSRSALSNTSKGNGRVKAENAKKIAEVLGCKLEDIVD